MQTRVELLVSGSSNGKFAQIELQGMSEINMEPYDIGFPLPFEIEEETFLEFDLYEHAGISNEELERMDDALDAKQSFSVEEMEADPRCKKLFLDNSFTTLQRRFKWMAASQKEPEDEKERLLVKVMRLYSGPKGTVNWRMVRKLRRKFVSLHEAENAIVPREIIYNKARFTNEENSLLLLAFSCNKNAAGRMDWKKTRSDSRFRSLFETRTLQSVKRHFSDVKNGIVSR